MPLVPTVTLFDRLIDRGVAPVRAYELIGEHLKNAGYPPDCRELSRVDAEAMMEAMFGTVGLS